MSTDAQLKGDSLRRQLDASAKYIADHDLELVQDLRDLGVEALRRSVGGGHSAESGPTKKQAKKSRKASAGQKEMLMSIEGKKPAKETANKKPATKRQRKSA